MEKININKEFNTIQELEDYCDELREKYIIMVIQSTGKTVDYILSAGKR